ncbi:MAG: DUF308 domain-containing protein [Acidobacteriaceae bacterium]|nr:DUF308 domain-containing protein [Acidobacteriaceae bacterium]MBV8571422.1 DUF308 domain-containing protein [Acidobacteriaceae bacterium]
MQPVAVHWWALALRGLVAIICGIISFAAPGAALALLVALFGAYALVDGVFAIVSTFRAIKGHSRWVPFLLEGIAGIVAGIITFLAPAITFAFLLLVVAFWAIVTGILEIVAAIRMRRHLPGEWFLLLTGVLSIVFGLIVLWRPLVGALAITIWLGAYLLLAGILLLALAFRLRGLREIAAATA